MQTYSGNTDYEPLVHTYNLMLDFPVVSLGGFTFLLNKKGIKDAINLVRHNQDFSILANQLKEQIPLLQKDTLEVEDLVNFIKNSTSRSIGYPAESYTDIILLLFWCNRIEGAEKEIAAAKNIISQWPEDVTQRFGGENGWEEQTRNLMNPDILKNTIEQQLQKFKLTTLEDYGLKC
jgi:hypothetical protein